jgi:amino acid adenylation domain-containing protein
MVAAYAESSTGTAVSAPHSDLDYPELDRRVRLFAEELLAAGVRRQDLVCVRVPERLDCLIAGLAVMAVGAVYTPTDPRHPQERVDAMMEASGVRFCVARDDAAVPPSCTLIRLADQADQTGPAGREPGLTRAELLAMGAGPHELCYVVHTSGSTGVPKGVAVEAAGLANLVDQVRAELAVGARERVVQGASPAFDASLFEWILAFSGGAALVVPGPRLEDLPRAVASASVASLTPSLLRRLSRADVAGLRLLICGGEALRGEDLAAVPPACRVLNVYGPTEATIVATWQDVEGRPRSGDLPIGGAIGGLRIRVVDQAGADVGAGEPGELVISGVGVARGYVGRPAETERVFGGSGSERWYRTGDVVVQRDGGLFFVGRLDGQLKVRGQRIELEEIVGAVVAAAGHGAVAVTPEPDGHGDLRLTAWIVGAAADDLERIQQECARTLTSAALPGRWRGVAALPLTVNGKVDVDRLLAEQAEQAAPDVPETCGYSGVAGSTAVPPAGSPGEGEVAQALSLLVCDLLGIEGFDPQSNFFDIGGHSLAVFDLQHRIQDVFGVEVPLEAVFDAQRMSDLGELIDAAVQTIHCLRTWRTHVLARGRRSARQPQRVGLQALRRLALRPAGVQLLRDRGLRPREARGRLAGHPARDQPRDSGDGAGQGDLPQARLPRTAHRLRGLQLPVGPRGQRIRLRGRTPRLRAGRRDPLPQGPRARRRADRIALLPDQHHRAGRSRRHRAVEQRVPHHLLVPGRSDPRPGR